MRYLPKSPEDRERMLREIGIRSVDDLFAPIPGEYRLNRDLDIAPSMAESDILDWFKQRAADVATGYAYFLGAGALPQLSKHANVSESCVGCHMKLNPQTHLSHGAAATSGHVFYIRDQDKGKVCANCHGSTDGEALVKSTEDGLAALGAKMVSSVQAKLDAASAAAPVYFKSVYLVDGTGAVVQNSAKAEVQANFVYDGSNKYASIVNTEVHGQIGQTYTLTTPITVTVSGVSYTVKSFEVGIGSIYSDAAMTANVYALSGNMVRAGWNYYLIEGDQSKGIHNPSFAANVIKASLVRDLSF